MRIPYVIDNQSHKLADALNAILAERAGNALDIATAYFNVGGYRLLRGRLHSGGRCRKRLVLQSAGRKRLIERG